ncbi:MAG: hypothetical protein E3J41_01925, partial [Candidatus Cloacimonadota bacterium]
MRKFTGIIFIVVISILLLGVSFLYAEWVHVTGGYLSNVHFVGNDGWVTDNYGRIRHSSDGGANWEIQESGVTERLYGVYFVSSTTGWISGNDGIILYTDDGGATWTPQTSGTTNRIETLFFTSALNGWAGGRYGTVLHTTDGGANWNPVTVTGSAVYSIYFPDELHGWLVASKYIFHTSDGGTNWTEQTNPSDKTLKRIVFVDTLKGWAVGSSGTIIHTTDGGSNWTGQT